MSLTNPIPRGTREVTVITAPGQLLFGPLDFLLYDAADLALSFKTPGGSYFVALDQSDFTVMPAAPATAWPAKPLVMLATALATGSTMRLRGVRVPSRATDVTRDGKLQSQSLERELDKQVSTEQELRRDIDRSSANADLVESIAGHVDGVAVEVEANRAAAQTARDEAVAALGSIASALLATAALAAATYHPTVAPDFIITQGKAAIGDGGASSYRKNGTAAGDLVITLEDGVTQVGYTAIGSDISASTFGATPGKVAAVDAEMAASIAAASALKVPWRVQAGRYNMISQLTLSALLDGAGRIELDGDVVLDFSAATNAANFPGGGFVYVDAGPLVRLPDLAANVVKGASSVVFQAAPGLKAGDRICIWNPDAGSFSPWRASYFAGEFCTVADGSGGATVKLYGTMFADYSAPNVYVYKHPNKKISVSGGTITIIESRAAGFGEIAGFKADRIADSDLSAFRSTQSLYAGMALKQCVGISGAGYQCNMVLPAGGDSCYGLIYGNCQDVIIQGEFNGGRHGANGGGYGDAGSVPSRNVHVSGTFRNSPDAIFGLGAVGFHGNCEHCSFEGAIEGGVTIGGNHNSVFGTISTRPTQNGLAVLFGEMLGTSFKIAGRISVPAAVVDTPVISIGDFGTSPLTANTLFGGTLDFSGVEFDCPYNSRLITLQNSGANPAGPMVLDIRGAKWPRSLIVPTHSLIISKLGGRDFDLVLMAGFVNGPNAPYAMGAAAKVRGWRASGTVALTPNTGASETTSNPIAINAPYPPKVILGQRSATIGGSRAYAYVYSATATAIQIGALTCNGANFASSVAGNVDWLAVTDD